MSELRLGLHGNCTEYRPGETIAGAADWQVESAPASAEVRLCWYTRGKGSEDAAIVRVLPFEMPRATDLRPFSFPAPAAPYSFSGRLVSLVWAVELVLEPGQRFQRVEITIAPEGRERLLREVAGTEKKKWFMLTEMD